MSAYFDSDDDDINDDGDFYYDNKNYFMTPVFFYLQYGKMGPMGVLNWTKYIIII